MGVVGSGDERFSRRAHPWDRNGPCRDAKVMEIVGASRATGRMERHDLLTANSEGVRCPSVVL
jgi:hypothetical protein